MTTERHKQTFSKIKEVVAVWSNIQQLLRSGDEGQIVPVVIPKERRGFGWLFWVGLGIYCIGAGIFSGNGFLAAAGIGLGLLLSIGAIIAWLLGTIIEIEQGTTGIKSSFGAITGTMEPGRHFLLWPWDKVEFIVDTSTEIPYTAPVLASPTYNNVPLKSIEFFLKFRIEDPVAFVRNLGATNFDAVLSSAVQDAIRQRSRKVETEKAYDLRGSDVGDMQNYLNRLLKRYGVRIIGANIPDVQLPTQYQQHLATRERVSKELAAYEREWELIRKQRTDTLLMEMERAKKDRDARLVQVRAAINKAREDVAQILQEQETEAQKVRLEIEAKGRAELKAAENEAKALSHLGRSYKDNRAVLQYQLALRRLEVAERLAQQAPRPLLVNSEGGDTSALSTLLLAQVVPNIVRQSGDGNAQQSDGSGNWRRTLQRAAQQPGSQQFLEEMLNKHEQQHHHE